MDCYFEFLSTLQGINKGKRNERRRNETTKTKLCIEIKMPNKQTNGGLLIFF